MWQAHYDSKEWKFNVQLLSLSRICPWLNFNRGKDSVTLTLHVSCEFTGMDVRTLGTLIEDICDTWSNNIDNVVSLYKRFLCRPQFYYLKNSKTNLSYFAKSMLNR